MSSVKRLGSSSLLLVGVLVVAGCSEGPAQDAPTTSSDPSTASASASEEAKPALTGPPTMFTGDVTRVGDTFLAANDTHVIWQGSDYDTDPIVVTGSATASGIEVDVPAGATASTAIGWHDSFLLTAYTSEAQGLSGSSGQFVHRVGADGLVQWKVDGSLADLQDGVALVSRDGSAIGVDAETGTELWSVPFTSQFGSGRISEVEGEDRASNTHERASGFVFTENGRLRALDAATGATTWEAQPPQGDGTEKGEFWDGFTSDTAVVYWNDKSDRSDSFSQNLVMFDRETGARTDVTLGTGDVRISVIASTNAGVVLSIWDGTTSTRKLSTYRADGTVAWTTDLPEGIGVSSMMGAGDVLYVFDGSHDQVSVIDASTGDQLSWTQLPADFNGTLVGHTGDALVFDEESEAASTPKTVTLVR